MVLLLLLASLVGFIALLHATGSQIRVDFVLASIGRLARDQLARHLPRQTTTPTNGDDQPDTVGDADLTPVDYSGRSGHVVAIDVRHLTRLTRRQGITLKLDLRVGDAIMAGTPIAATDAPRASSLARAISRCLIVDDERSLVHDPLYALRLLVDIAIRALSPAVNDPTTAVRSLDEIEGVLRAAASRRLGTIRLATNPGRLEISTATWDEVVDLALLEIAECGRRPGPDQQAARGPARGPDLRRRDGPTRGAAGIPSEPASCSGTPAAVWAGSGSGTAARQAGFGRLGMTRAAWPMRPSAADLSCGRPEAAACSGSS